MSFSKIKVNEDSNDTAAPAAYRGNKLLHTPCAFAPASGPADETIAAHAGARLVLRAPRQHRRGELRW
jgi:hypothetical protein